jgi:hypothetical protein
MKKLIRFVIMLQLILFTSCSENKNSKSVEIEEDCIQQEYTFAYPINKYGLPDIINNEVALPGKPWKMISGIEDELVNHSSIKLINRINNQTEVWVEVTKNEKGQKTRISYIVYNLEEDTWKAIDNVNDNQFSDIYNTNDSQVWGLNKIETNRDACFSQYNPDSNQFVTIPTSIGLPCSADTSSSDLVAFDPSGYFWFLVNHDAIYRYKISDGLFEKMFDAKNFEFSKVRLAKDGSIYFTDQTMEMYHFNPKDKSYTSFTIPFREWDSGFNFFVDAKDRIWFSQLGWRDVEGNWFEFVAQPEFIPINEMEINNADPFVFVNPFLDIATVTSNDVVWLNSYSGVYKANINEGKWCWITTEFSNVLEDEDGYVWLLVENKLYRRPV